MVLNASGVGMGQSIGKTPLPPEFIQKDQFYFDACYNPARTRFLENAEKAGCRVMNGLTMSLYQARPRWNCGRGRRHRRKPCAGNWRRSWKKRSSRTEGPAPKQESRMESMMMENVKESSKAVQQKNSLNALIHWLDLHLEETFLVVMLVLIAGVTMLQVIVRKIPGMALSPGQKNCAGSCGSGAFFCPCPIPSGSHHALPCRKDAGTQKAPGEPLGSSPGASPMHRYFTPVHNSYSISIRFGFTGRAFCC